jgi:two-component system, cell cycle sensor histidine kinase and response regulator CckA
MSRQQRLLVRYAGAAAAAAAGFLLRMALEAWVGPGLPTYITFYPSVMIVALIAGIGPGLLATALIAIAVDYWLLLPLGFGIENPMEAVGMALFVTMGAFLSVVAGLYRRTRFHLQDLVEARTAELTFANDRMAQMNAGLEQRVVEQTAEIRKANETLEARIAERTAELQAANDSLRDSHRAALNMMEDALAARRQAEQVSVDLRKEMAEHKLAEEQILRAKQEWERTFDTVPDLIAILDNQHRIVRANVAMAEHLGMATGQCLGMQCFQCVHDSKQPIDACPHVQMLKDGMEHVAEVHEERLGGYFLVSVSPLLDDQGRVTGAVHVARDITERKKAEAALQEYRDHLEELVRERTRELADKSEQLLQAQKMEAIGRLAGGVAHDFNNLMTVVVGYSDRLLRRTDGDPQLMSGLKQIHQAGERATALTRQLLTFSRKQAFFPKLLDLNAAVLDIMKMLPTLLREDVEVKTDLAPGLAPIWADGGQIDQVIMNLATNARDAMRHGGLLTIRTANVRLIAGLRGIGGDIPPGSYAVLTVGDTGSGMDAEVLAHIFEPFFTTKGQGAGTGLGLSSVFGVVKQANGYIVVDSVPDHGTTFRMYFPEAPADKKAASPLATKPVSPPAGKAVSSAAEMSAESARKTGGETLLLIEDEEAVRLFTALNLREMGYTVLEAADGDQALRASFTHPGVIHLLISDVVLPRMSGPHVFARLREQRPNLSVIYMSGYTDRHLTPTHGTIAPGVPLLQKPFDMAVLAGKVREIIDAARTQSSIKP